MNITDAPFVVFSDSKNKETLFSARLLMYCPVCSLQHVSDEGRFCSRCGFPLSTVRDLIAAGGTLAESVPEAQSNRLSRAFKGMKTGVWIILAGFPLLFVIGLLTAINDVFAVLLLMPALCFMIGFVRLLYGAFFEERAPRTKAGVTKPQLGPSKSPQMSSSRNPELLPARGAPPEDFASQRMKTGEIVQPPSVTENTTKLLDEEAHARRR